MLSLIVARGRGGAIGKGGTIPWNAPEDLASFQRETIGGALVMGRRTWESLPVKPLKGRLNIVVTSRQIPSVTTCRDVHAACELGHVEGYRRLYGIGGARIYEALLPVADRMLITEVDATIEGADAFFPEFDEANWRVTGKLELRQTPPRCVLREWLRR